MHAKLVVAMLLLGLTGCASNTRNMADSIHPSTPQFNEPACQRSFLLAPLHDEIKLTRSIATPSLMHLMYQGCAVEWALQVGIFLKKWFWAPGLDYSQGM